MYLVYTRSSIVEKTGFLQCTNCTETHYILQQPAPPPSCNFASVSDFFTTILVIFSVTCNRFTFRECVREGLDRPVE